MASSLKEYFRESMSEYLSLIKNRFNGDSTVKFKVADAVDPDEATSLSQVQGMVTSLADFAEVVKASEGCLNANPYFLLDDYDYTAFGNKASIVTDVVSTNSKSLRWDGTGGVTCLGTQPMSLAVGREYRAVCDIRSNLDGSPDPSNRKVSFYLGVVSYDSDNKIIYPYNLPNRPKDKVAIVAVNAVVGDTSLIVTGTMDMFSNNTGAGHARNILLYLEQPSGELCYIGDNGRQYEHLAYSRYLPYKSTGHYDQNSIVDNGDGTLTIPLTFALPMDLPIGSGVKSTQAGGTFTYWISNGKATMDDKWNRFASTWREYNTTYSHGYDGVIRNGTAYVKFMLLPNYSMYTSSDSYIGSVLNNARTYYGTLALEWRAKQ